jgi:hypothetical protein
VEITAVVAADLAALTEALEEPGADLATTLDQLAADAKLAVGTFLGLTVRVTIGDRLSNLTAFEAGAVPGDIRASLLMPLQDGVNGESIEAGTDLVLYAGTPGAFTDLAADLAWLSGRDLTEFALDQHLVVPERDGADGLSALSLINQAIGVLIARGRTPEQAESDLNARAARGGVDRHIAAGQILTAARRFLE